MKECVLAMLTVFCGTAPDTTESEADVPEVRPVPAPEEKREDGPDALLDQALVYGATVAYTAVHVDVRQRIVRRASWANIGNNFTDPIGRAIEGAGRDHDSFLTNYVSHPLSWGLVGYYLRSQGHSFWSSFAMSQAHSVFWEYIVEGSYAYPSGKDLITNVGGALLGIALAEWVHGGDLDGVALQVRPGPAYAMAGSGGASFGSAAAAAPTAPGAAVTVSIPVSH